MHIDSYIVFPSQTMTTFMPPPPAATFLAFHPQDNNVIAIGMEDSSIQIYNVRVDEVLTRTKAGMLFLRWFNAHMLFCYLFLWFKGKNQAQRSPEESNWPCIFQCFKCSRVIWSWCSGKFNDIKKRKKCLYMCLVEGKKMRSIFFTTVTDEWNILPQFSTK